MLGGDWGKTCWVQTQQVGRGGLYIGLVRTRAGLVRCYNIKATDFDWTSDDSAMGTRWQFRYALLTYAQCGDLDPFKIVDHLCTLGAECIIGRENHQDGGIHLHAFVDFGRKFRSSDTKAFDVEGFHPNVSPSKGRPGEGYDYAVKDGDVVAGGLERPSGGPVPRAGIDWAEAMSSSSMDEFLESCLRMDPNAALRMFTQLQSYAKWRYRPEPTPYMHPSNVELDTSGVPELDEWVAGNIDRENLGGTYLC